MYQVPLKNGELEGINLEWVNMWEDAYGEQFVDKEIKKAIMWNYDNPAKRKTKRGLRRHLGMWLASAWEKSGGADDNMKELT